MKIKHVLFETSNKCNFFCRYCYFNKNQKILDTNQIKRILKILKNQYECKTIGFTGGEPFLRPDLPEIIKYARKIGFKIAVGTNGSMINLIPEDIIKNINTLIISFDGDEKYFNFITRTLKYKLLINNMKLLQSNNIKFGIHYNITPMNLKYFKSHIKKCIRLGAKFIQIGSIQPTLNQKNIKKLFLNNNQREILYNMIEKAKADCPDIKFDNPLITKEEFLAHRDEIMNGKMIFSPFFVISPSGALFPMVDAPLRWKLTETLEKPIKFKILKEFILRLKKAAINCEKEILNNKVVNPYNYINKEIK